MVMVYLFICRLFKAVKHSTQPCRGTLDVTIVIIILLLLSLCYYCYHYYYLWVREDHRNQRMYDDNYRYHGNMYVTIVTMVTVYVSIMTW